MPCACWVLSVGNSLDDKVQFCIGLCGVQTRQNCSGILNGNCLCITLGCLFLAQPLLFLPGTAEMAELTGFLVLAATCVEEGAWSAPTAVVQERTDTGGQCASDLWCRQGLSQAKHCGWRRRWWSWQPGCIECRRPNWRCWEASFQAHRLHRLKHRRYHSLGNALLNGGS